MSPRALAVAAAVALAALTTAACSDDGGHTSAAPASTTGPATSLAASSGPDETSAADDADDRVVSRQITIDDPTHGELTFDALAAGDPDAAPEGRLVLLLHGFPETSSSYREVLPALAAAGYYAVAPDQRGYSPGARPAGVEHYAVTLLVGDVTAMADALGATEGFHVVGHDWGGAVAWLTAALVPERVTSLTALSTPHLDALDDAYAQPDGAQAAASGYMSLFRAEGFEDRLLADGPQGFVDFFVTGGGIPVEAAERYAEVLGTPDALGAAVDWYRANPLPADVRIGPVRVPTLYVFGATDLAFTRFAADTTERYVDADYTYEVFPDAGHWLPETEAARIAPLLVAHLDRHGARDDG